MRDDDLVLLLLDRHTLRGRRLIKLASTWPRAAEVKGKDARLQRWALVSGVPLTVVRVLAPILLDNGICIEGGTVDSTAAAVVSEVIVEALESAEAKSRPRHAKRATSSEAVGEAGGGTASGGIAGSNFGDGEPDTAELADAMGSGAYDAHYEEDLNDLEGEDAETPQSRENRHPAHR